MPIVLNARNLFKGRLRAVQIMLQPLGQGGKPIPCTFVPHPRASIICGYGGGKIHNHMSAWFPTCASGIQGQYYEIWYPRNNEEEWWMERAYFSLRKVVSDIARSEEIICIHSDPMCEDANPLGLYKKGPHLHVSVAKSPISEAHFPLNLGHLEQVLASCESLSNAISIALEVIKNEVIPRF